MRARLLEGRTDEIIGLAGAVHEARVAEGREDDRLADYYAAETLLIQETFQRQIGCTASLLSALRVRHAASVLLWIRLSQGLGWAGLWGRGQGRHRWCVSSSNRLGSRPQTLKQRMWSST